MRWHVGVRGAVQWRCSKTRMDKVRVRVRIGVRVGVRFRVRVRG